MFCLSVCLLLFFSYGHSKQTRSLLLLFRNIHLTLTLKSLCVNKLKVDDEV